AHAVEPRAEFRARPPLPLRPRRALGNLEIGVTDQLEIPRRRVFLELLERQVEGVDVGRDLHILDAWSNDLSGRDPCECTHHTGAEGRKTPSSHWIPPHITFLFAYHWSLPGLHRQHEPPRRAGERPTIAASQLQILRLQIERNERTHRKLG